MCEETGAPENNKKGKHRLGGDLITGSSCCEATLQHCTALLWLIHTCVSEWYACVQNEKKRGCCLLWKIYRSKAVVKNVVSGICYH